MTPADIYEKLSQNGHVYNMGEMNDYFAEIDKVTGGHLPFCKERRKNGKEIYNIAASFDTETTSFETTDGEKVGIMYIWILDINGLVIYGRTWWEFIRVYEEIVNRYNTEQIIFPIYVHNLAFDFQFFRRWFHFSNIFALDKMEPIRATTIEGVEFRCSYKLSGLSLKTTAENLLKYQVKKLVGDLDYNKLRHSETPLTDKELGYCVNDVRVVVSFILEEIEANNGLIIDVPMTKTGYVRRYCRNKCYGGDINDKKQRNKQYTNYRDLMSALTLTVEEYEQLRRAFAGGFTHGSNWTVGRTQENVTSVDECSAYPAMIVAKKYPMSKAEKIDQLTREEFAKSLKAYCCIFDARFVNIRAKRGAEHTLSFSKTIIPKTSEHFEDNGKIVFADELFTTLTEVDYRVLKQFYTWDEMNVANFRRYSKGYLPKPLIEAVLDFYAAKTTLKGLPGKEQEYQVKKGMLNGTYGMMVTNILRDIISYSNDWGQWNNNQPANIEEVIKQYNNSKGRFLSYNWGVWVTAYAREAVLSYGVKPCGSDYCYTDTDSVKFLNGDAHKDHFELYNKMITAELEKALKHHGIPADAIKPKTQKGKEKPLGIFEFEHVYKKFKSNGAKRYMVQMQNDEIVLTVSGLRKKDALLYMMQATRTPYHIEDDAGTTYDENNTAHNLESFNHIIADGDTTTLFDYFDENLTIPAGHTGKNLHSYFNHEITGEMVDYLGNVAEYYEKSGVNLSPVSYSSNVNTIWLSYIFGKAGITYEN